MRELNNLHAIAASDYQNGMAVLNHIAHVADHCAGLLENPPLRPLAECDGKMYHVFSHDINRSRPLRMSLFIRDRRHLQEAWNALCDSALPSERRFGLPPAEINAVLYSVSMAFAVSFDLWRPSSRKTPGTFLEVVIGSLLQAVLPETRRVAHLSLIGKGEKLSTDIAFLERDKHQGLVVPVKITTRERIVQPFAHQRILDSVFGKKHFRSVLVCVSEMQRQGSKGANAICVPGTIRLFQKHLASLSGLYYLDPPNRYLQSDVTDYVPVRTVGDLLAHDLPNLVGVEQA